MTASRGARRTGLHKEGEVDYAAERKEELQDTALTCFPGKKAAEGWGCGLVCTPKALHS